MFKHIEENRHTQIKNSLFNVCHESGIFTDRNIEEAYHDDLIESGIVDSMAVVCLQSQIEAHFNVNISLEQFIAELHTLEKLVNFLAADATVQVPA